MSKSRVRTTMSSITEILNDYGPIYYSERRLGRYEHGRVYVAGKTNYIFPVDQLEGSRQDSHDSYIAKYFLGLDSGEEFRPLQNDNRIPTKILDLGCGTGLWAISIARRFPNATVYAVDLVDSGLSTGSLAPRNVIWRQLDFERPRWDLGEGTFDLIHLSHLCGSVANWDHMFSKCFRTLAPGGRLETIETDWTPRCHDGTLPQDSDLHRWWSHMLQATSQRSIAYRHDTGEMLEQAGFVNVRRYGPFQMPFNEWPANDISDTDLRMIARELGASHRLNMTGGTARFDAADWEIMDEGFKPYRGLEALTIGPFTRGLGWKPQDVWDFLKKVEKFLKSRRYHCEHHVYMWTAEKPS